jgi:hypothetical protein
MVAASKSMPQALPLLFSPDQPPLGLTRTNGWRWTVRNGSDVLVRRPQDDAHGAMVQWIVLRYYRDGVTRGELAREYGYAERTIQGYLSKCSYMNHWHLAYAAPVLRALTRAGIPCGGYSHSWKRQASQLAAARAALIAVADLLADDERLAARRLRRDVGLLTIELPGGCDAR